MPLSDLRTDFIERTGREDLVSADIDKFINDGLKILDELSNFEKAPARAFPVLAANAYTVDFSSQCRLIKSVWVLEKQVGRFRLELVDEEELREFYSLPSTVEKGRPTYYSPRIIRAHPDTFDKGVSPYTDYTEFIDTTVDYKNYRGITVMPPADKEYVLEIRGKFFSPALTDSATDNWWSINHYDAVLLAALYKYELSMRNTEGTKDHMAGLLPILSGIDLDIAEEESVNVTRMEG
jgi:hypothetical protein